MLDLRQVLDKLLQVQAHGGGGVPVGTIALWTNIVVPDGWLPCDGRSLSRTVYEELFDEIGTTYGNGDGSTTFNLPDFRDRFPIGSGLTYNLNGTGGNKDAIIPYHNHSIDAQTSGVPSNNITTSSGSHKHRVSQNYDSGGAMTPSPGGYLRFNTPAHSGSTGTCDENYPSLMWSAGAHTHSMQSHTHTIAAHNTNYVGTNDNLTNANLPPYLGIKFIIYTGVFQTIAVQTTWTPLADRIINSQLNIVTPTFFDDKVIFDDDIKIQLNTSASVLDTDLANAINSLNTNYITNSQFSLKEILNKTARSVIRKGEITLGTTWSGSNPYTQIVTVNGFTVTNNMKIDLMADSTAIQTLLNDHVNYLYIENNNSILTCYSIGGHPQSTVTLQCTGEEVMV